MSIVKILHDVQQSLKFYEITYPVCTRYCFEVASSFVLSLQSTEKKSTSEILWVEM